MSSRDRATIPVIHAITNDEIICSPGFLERAYAVMNALGARGAVHLRASKASGSFFHAMAEKLAESQRATESWLVINDRVDVALAVGARGVQLTSRSMKVQDVLQISKGLAVGASVHSLEEAREAERGGAAWLVAGHVYQTASHPTQGGRGEDFIAEFAWSITAPIIAIGGILPENVASMKAAGALGVAAIRGIWTATDTEAAATEYLSRYDADGDR